MHRYRLILRRTPRLAVYFALKPRRRDKCCCICVYHFMCVPLCSSQLLDPPLAPAEVNPFSHMEKMSVLTESRAFHDSNFVKMHPKRCCQHLTKLLWFFTQGDPVDGPESGACVA